MNAQGLIPSTTPTQTPQRAHPAPPRAVSTPARKRTCRLPAMRRVSMWSLACLMPHRPRAGCLRTPRVRLPRSHQLPARPEVQRRDPAALATAQRRRGRARPPRGGLLLRPRRVAPPRPLTTPDSPLRGRGLAPPGALLLTTGPAHRSSSSPPSPVVASTPPPGGEKTARLLVPWKRAAG